MTNNHVVEGWDISKINYYNKEYNTELITTDKTLDLALLKVNLKPKSYISFSNKEPKKRQKIIIAGYPLGKGLSDDLKINDGRISSLKGFENNTNEVIILNVLIFFPIKDELLMILLRRTYHILAQEC